MKREDEKPVDGRANAAAFDLSKVSEFKQLAGVKGQDKRRAKEVTTTPIAHQSGKGTRGLRESYRGFSKVGLIRWCAAHGLSYDKTWVFIAQTFAAMTKAVFSKAWGEGEKGHDATPVLDAETAQTVKRACK